MGLVESLEKRVHRRPPSPYVHADNTVRYKWAGRQKHFDLVEDTEMQMSKFYDWIRKQLRGFF